MCPRTEAHSGEGERQGREGRSATDREGTQGWRKGEEGGRLDVVVRGEGGRLERGRRFSLSNPFSGAGS